MVCHVLAYAEILFAWQLPQKRSELLKSVEKDLRSGVPETVVTSLLESSPIGLSTLLVARASGNSLTLGVIRVCKVCGHNNQLGMDNCVSCAARLEVERCTVCRLPIRGTPLPLIPNFTTEPSLHPGLSHTCLLCLHNTHVDCWNLRVPEACASGCGCPCQYVAEHRMSIINQETLSPLNIGS